MGARQIILDILGYLRDHDPLDDFNRRVAEERRQLARYRRMRKRLPALIRELESIVRKIDGLLE